MAVFIARSRFSGITVGFQMDFVQKIILINSSAVAKYLDFIPDFPGFLEINTKYNIYINFVINVARNALWNSGYSY